MVEGDQWRWCGLDTLGRPNEGSIIDNETHCPYGTKCTGGECSTGICPVDVGVGYETTGNQTFGMLMVPTTDEQPTLTAPWRNVAGCAHYLDDTTATDEGLFRLDLRSQGWENHNGDNGLPELPDDAQDITVNCIPPLAGIVDGVVVLLSDFGQGGPNDDLPCNTVDHEDDQLVNPDGVAGGDDGSGDGDGSDGSGSSIDVAGVEDRLDVLIAQGETAETSDAERNQTLDDLFDSAVFQEDKLIEISNNTQGTVDELREVNAELDELDENTERIADAAESIDDSLGEINDSLTGGPTINDEFVSGLGIGGAPATLGEAFDDFSDRISASEIGSGVPAFFDLGTLGGTCPTYSVDTGYVGVLTFDQWCSQTMLSIWPWVQAVLLVVASFYAFRIAFL